MSRSAIAALASRVLWHANRTPLSGLIKAGLRVANRREVSHRRRLAVQLGRPESRLAELSERLNRDGYVDVSDVVDPTLVSQLQRASDERIARAAQLEKSQHTTHKSFWVRLLDGDTVEGKFPSDGPFVRFATQTPIIRILTSALGEVPQLSDVLLTLSRESKDELSYSQLWHRDFDDVRTLKLFVYLTDVDAVEDGPFTFVPGPASDRFGMSLRSHMSDSKVYGVIKRSEVQELRGKRGTTFIVETSRCLHMGSRVAPGHHRLLYTGTFVTVPRPYAEPAPRFLQRGPLDALTETVLFRRRRPG